MQNMTDTQIENIAKNVEAFLARETKNNQKINQMEEKMDVIQNYFTAPDNIFVDHEQKGAFNDYLRKGLQTELVTKSLSSNEDSGGVLITPDLHNQIISSVHNKSIMRLLASSENISTSALDIVIEDGKFGFGWVENTEKRDDTETPKLKKKTIHVHEVFAQPKATQRLIDDSAINIESWLSERLSDSFARAENEVFLNGDGDKKPFGLLRNNQIERIEVGANVTPEILLNLINHLDEEYISSATFLMNRATLSIIQGMKDENGRFIWQQSMSDPLKQTIFGVPVVCMSHMPNIADNALAIAVGDFKATYKIVDRSNVSIMRDPYTDKPFVKFYAVKRVGGDVVNPDAMKFAKFGG